jgi:homoserine kinase
MKDGWIGAFAPATVANFGSGFDSFGVALRPAPECSLPGERRKAPGDVVRVRRAKRRGVRIAGITGDGGRLPADPARNCASVAAAAVLRAGRADFGLDLLLEKGLPLSSGLGSSAASAAAGAWAAGLAVAAELGSVPDKSDAGVLAGSLAGEHAADGAWHGDNVWASLLGGALVVVSSRPAEILPLRTSRRLRLIIVHPDFRLDTRRARAALPRRVPLAAAIGQAARFASLAGAWAGGDRHWIGRGLEDLLAEPPRSRLVPGFTAAKRAAMRAGAFGMTFSGAGPSVVAVGPEGEEEKIGHAIQRGFARAGLASRVLICAVDGRGTRETG